MQFADRELRRFNLVALDLRCHAQTIGKAGKAYGREVAARDVALFMVSRLHRIFTAASLKILPPVDPSDPTISFIRNVNGRLYCAADSDPIPLIRTFNLRRIVSAPDRGAQQFLIHSFFVS